MSKHIIKFISFVGAMVLLLSIMPISFAYDSETQIIYSKSFEQYSNETTQTVNEVEAKLSYDEERAIENEYYTYRAIVSAPNIRSISFARFSPLKVLFDETGEIAILTFLNAKDTQYAVETLNKQDNIEFAEADSIVQIPDDENDAIQLDEIENTVRDTYTWGRTAMNCDRYSKYLQEAGYDTGIVVAVVDTGIDMDHPYFTDRIMNNGYDYVSGDSNPDDDHGHGTHVSGTILDCVGDLLVGILPVKVLNSAGQGSTSNIANGVKYAINKGAKVINMSLGGSHSYYIDKYVNNAHKNGTVVCVAAGNESENCSNSCPAHIANAITVSSIDQNYKFSSFSNYGAIDVCGPGENITSAYIGGGYATLDGTSMATPHISAACAMIKLNYPSFSANDIMTALQFCARDLGDEGYDSLYGYGLPNLEIIFDLHTHTSADWEIISPATCVNNGVKVKLCKYCGELMETGTVQAVGEHAFGEWNIVTTPTCQNKGLQTRKCSKCSEIQTQELEKTDHDCSETVVAKTCDTDGYTLHQCKNCTYYYTTDIVSASHEIEDTVVPANCKTAGYTRHQCKKCTYYYDDTPTELLPHTPGDWTLITPATVSIEGLEGQYCSVCKELVNSRPIEKLKVIFEKSEDSSLVIDKENKLIYGLPSEIESFEDLISLENCTVEIHENENGFGTGSTVDVIVGGEVYETYKILVFGDVTGDGIIDESDIIIINLYVSWNMEDTESFENSVKFKAADLTGDGVLDESDLIVFYMANAWLCTINQSNPTNLIYE